MKRIEKTQINRKIICAQHWKNIIKMSIHAKQSTFNEIPIKF